MNRANQPPIASRFLRPKRSRVTAGERLSLVAGLGLAALLPADGWDLSTGPFRESDLQVELVGVCRVQEGSARCWGPDGLDRPELTRRLRTFFARNEALGFPVRPREKCRLAVFRSTVPAGTLSPSVRISSNAPFGGISWESPSSGLPGEPVVTESAVYLQEDAQTSTGKAAVTISRPHPVSDAFPLALGSRIRYQDWDLTVEEVIALPAREIHSGAQSFPVPASWTYRLSRRSGSGPLDWAFSVLDRRGLPITAVNAKGLPVSEPASIVPGRWLSSDPRVRQALYPMVEIRKSTAPEPEITIITNIDPRAVSAVVIQARTTSAQRLTGIPLEPRS